MKKPDPNLGSGPTKKSSTKKIMRGVGLVKRSEGT